MCRKSAGITENLQKICRYYKNVHKICRALQKSANVTQYWKSYYAKNKVQIKQRLRDQKQRKLGAWDQKTEKLQTSLVPRDTLCETPTIKT